MLIMRTFCVEIMATTLPHPRNTSWISRKRNHAAAASARVTPPPLQVLEAVVVAFEGPPPVGPIAQGGSAVPLCIPSAADLFIADARTRFARPSQLVSGAVQ
jgi:hypothetical protein